MSEGKFLPKLVTRMLKWRTRRVLMLLF